MRLHFLADADGKREFYFGARQKSDAINNIDEHHDACEFSVKLFGWMQEHPLVVVRERVHETKGGGGPPVD